MGDSLPETIDQHAGRENLLMGMWGISLATCFGYWLPFIADFIGKSLLRLTYIPEIGDCIWDNHGEMYIVSQRNIYDLPFVERRNHEPKLDRNKNGLLCK